MIEFVGLSLQSSGMQMKPTFLTAEASTPSKETFKTLHGSSPIQYPFTGYTELKIMQNNTGITISFIKLIAQVSSFESVVINFNDHFGRKTFSIQILKFKIFIKMPIDSHANVHWFHENNTYSLCV